MLSIRLSRTGKTHAPHYRIVVQEKRSKKEGKSIDIIGHYHPAQPGKELVVDKEKAQKWLDNGAQPSDTVTNLFVKTGLFDTSKKIHHTYASNKVEEASQATPEVSDEEVAEMAAEEVAAEEVAEEPSTEATPEVEEPEAK